MFLITCSRVQDLLHCRSLAPVPFELFCRVGETWGLRPRLGLVKGSLEVSRSRILWAIEHGGP